MGQGFEPESSLAIIGALFADYSRFDKVFADIAHFGEVWQVLIELGDCRLDARGDSRYVHSEVHDEAHEEPHKESATTGWRKPMGNGKAVGEQEDIFGFKNFNNGEIESFLKRMGGKADLDGFLRQFAKLNGSPRLGSILRKKLVSELETLQRDGKLKIREGVIWLG